MSRDLGGDCDGSVGGSLMKMKEAETGQSIRRPQMERKSLSLETCRELGTLISQRKLRIHWRYDLSVL